MGKLGLFGWLGIVVLAAGLCVQGVRWIRADAVAELQREIAAETARVQQDAETRIADITAQNQRDAEAAKATDAEREQHLEALTLKIADLEGKNATCGTISRDTVRALNSLR
jgi:hypothetical protein